MSRYDDMPDAARTLMENFDEIDLAEMLASAHESAATLRQEVAQLSAARDRTIAQMQTYSAAGSGGVNPRQVINLLSLTWPDGNYEAAPAADHA